ncbi:MAG: ribosome-associated translation inhibitor RaiA [Rhodothermales bacterium]|nr:ribosome-associated translation inhibitor RaiA [Rhodothermales bacterium]
MKPRITARHFSLTDKLRDVVHEKYAKIEKYYDGITDARVILTVERGRPKEKTAEIIITVFRQTLSSRDVGPSHEKALDNCVEGLRRQLLKYKGKLKDTTKDVHR